MKIFYKLRRWLADFRRSYDRLCEQIEISTDRMRAERMALAKQEISDLEELERRAETLVGEEKAKREII